MGFFDMGRQLMQAADMYDASISYLRRTMSAENAIVLPAKIGKSHTVSTNIDGVIIHENWIDFIVPYAQLGFIPAVGDTITYNGVEYAVNAPADEQCYRWHILHESLRIHTQGVNKEN